MNQTIRILLLTLMKYLDFPPPTPFGPSARAAYGILALQPGIKPTPLALEDKVLTTGPPGSPPPPFSFTSLNSFSLSFSSRPLPSFAQSCNIFFISVPRALYLIFLSVLCSTLCGNIKIILFLFFRHKVWLPNRDLQPTLLAPHPTLSAFTSLMTWNACVSPPGQGAWLQAEPEVLELVTPRVTLNPFRRWEIERQKNFLAPD